VTLPALGDDTRFWTAAEAAALLGPPELTVTQVRQLIRLTSIAPAGRRKPGPRSRGRWPSVYAAEDLIRAYDAVYRAGLARGTLAPS